MLKDTSVRRGLSNTSSSACAQFFLSALEAQTCPLNGLSLWVLQIWVLAPAVLLTDILEVRLFEEPLIIACAGRLHTILHAADLHVPGPGKGGKCFSLPWNIYHVNLYNFLSKLVKEICHQHPQFKVTGFRAPCLQGEKQLQRAGLALLSNIPWLWDLCCCLVPMLKLQEFTSRKQGSKCWYPIAIAALLLSVSTYTEQRLFLLKYGSGRAANSLALCELWHTTGLVCSFFQWLKSSVFSKN